MVNPQPLRGRFASIDNHPPAEQKAPCFGSRCFLATLVKVCWLNARCWRLPANTQTLRLLIWERIWERNAPKQAQIDATQWNGSTAQ